MTIKRDHGVWPIKYEVDKKNESELVQIFKWVESQVIPHTVIDEAMFLEKLVLFVIDKFGKKSIEQKNYFLAIIDLLRLKEIKVNNQYLILKDIYMSAIEQDLFSFSYDVLSQPIKTLLENNLIYPAILIVSFYSNLGFGTYEAAEGYDGSNEIIKLEYLEYLVTKNVKNLSELEKSLKIFTPEINSGMDVNYGGNRKFQISEVALELKQLKNLGLKSLSAISIPGFIYGIINENINKKDLQNLNLKQILKANSNFNNIFDEIDVCLSDFICEIG